MPASGEAESTTKATISKGTIEIRDKENQKQDINKLNRDNQNSLNKLGEIFDKTKIEERQELANLFGELAYNEIHYMDGSNEQKALYHAVVGGIMSKLTGGDFLAGATAAGINKLVIEEIDKVAGGDPDKAQWVSAVLGAVISGLMSGNTQAGASTAASGTKNNEYLKKEEIIEIMFANGRAEEYLKQKGVSVNDEDMLLLKEAMKNICDENLDSDAIMLSYGATFNTDIVYDLKDKTSYLSNGGSVGSGWPAGCSLVAVKIIALDDSIDINDIETRRNILTGQSFTLSGFFAVGGGISFPINSPFNGKVKLLIKGIGTPQIGAGVSSTEKSIDRVTRLYDDAKNNPYGSD